MIETNLPCPAEGYSLAVVLDRITKNFLYWNEQQLRDAFEEAIMIKNNTVLEVKDNRCE